MAILVAPARPSHPPPVAGTPASAAVDERLGPLAAADAAGNLQIVWREDNVVRTRRRAPNGRPGPVYDLSSGRAWVYAPRVAVAPDGRAVVVWITLDRRSPVIHGARIGPGGLPVGSPLTLSRARAAALGIPAKVRGEFQGSPRLVRALHGPSMAA